MPLSCIAELLLLHKSTAMQRSLQRWFVLFLAALCSTGQLHAKRLPIFYRPGDSVTLSLLYISPVPGLQTAFGHSQVRLINHNLHTDQVIDFTGYSYESTLHFLWQFLYGDIYYDIFSKPTEAMYKEERTIYELPLLLTKHQKDTLIEYLKGKYFFQSGGSYLYDYLKKNCSTIMRDILKKTYGPDLRFPPKIDSTKTFRQIYREGLIRNPWIRFFSDIVLGPYNDRIPTKEEQMFAPKYLYLYFKDATAGQRPATGHPIRLIAFPERPLPKWYHYPHVYTWALLLIEIFYSIYLLRRRIYTLRLFDRLWFGIAGAFGVFILSLWVFSNYSYLSVGNINLLWLNPLMLLLAFAPAKDSKLRLLLLLLWLLSLIVLVGMPFFTQRLHEAFIPLILVNLIKLTRLLLGLRHQANTANIITHDDTAE